MSKTTVERERNFADTLGVLFMAIALCAAVDIAADAYVAVHSKAECDNGETQND